MDRRTFFFKQKVQSDELNGAFDAVEDGENALHTDQGFIGICFGMQVQENTSPDLHVRVLGAGAGYDDQGHHVAIPSTQTVDLALDSTSTSTAVVSSGNEKIVSVFIRFKRQDSDPRIDGNSLTVYFVNDDSFEFVVVQGAEGPHPASPPAKISHSLLLADITLTYGQTAIHNADISIDRRDDQFVVTPVNFAQIRAGTTVEAFTQLVNAIDSFFAGTAGTITYGGGDPWADGTTNPSTSVEHQLDKIIDDLATGSGTAKLHGAAISDSPDSLSAGTLAAQLTALLAVANDRLPLTGGTVTGDIIPSPDDVCSLGDSSHRWTQGYFDNVILNSLDFPSAVTRTMAIPGMAGRCYPNVFSSDGTNTGLATFSYKGLYDNGGGTVSYAGVLTHSVCSVSNTSQSVGDVVAYDIPIPLGATLSYVDVEFSALNTNFSFLVHKDGAELGHYNGTSGDGSNSLLTRRVNIASGGLNNTGLPFELVITMNQNNLFEITKIKYTFTTPKPGL